MSTIWRPASTSVRTALARKARPSTARGASRGGRAAFGGSGGTVELGHPERQIEGLPAIEARVARRLVTQRKILFRDLVPAADALGDVVAGELDVDSARVRAQGVVNLEEARHLVEHVVDAAGLVTARRLEGVAVHGVADP